MKQFEVELKEYEKEQDEQKARVNQIIEDENLHAQLAQ